MRGALVIVHGDVGRDPGAGMIGGKIIVNGRCPNPANGVSMSALTKKEVSDINSQISNQEYHIPNDALCYKPKKLFKWITIQTSFQILICPTSTSLATIENR